MELESALYERRSIRIYDHTKMVDKETIEKIISAGMWAPSACDVQGWKFIVIDDKKIFNNILKAGAAAFLKNTNQAILVLYDNRTDNTEYNDYIQSASACIQNMLLYAHSVGVGTCWVNNLPEKKKLKKILDIPWNYDPIAMVSLGYYHSNQVNPRRRKYNVEEVVCYNRYTFNKEEKNKDYLKLKIKRIARKIYYKLPCKNMLLKFAGKYEKKFDN